MKKLIIICASLSLGLIACKKDRTCSCTITTTQTGSIVMSGQTININSTSNETRKETIEKTTKSNALANDCASTEIVNAPTTLNSTQTNSTGTTTDNFNITTTMKTDCSLD